MRQKEIEVIAGQLFSVMLNSDLTEAETVSAIAIAVTMRLAYETETMEELIEKLERLAPLVIEYAKANLHAFEAAQRAKKGALS